MKLTFGVGEFDQLLDGFELGQFVVFYGSRLSHVLSELLCVRAQLSYELGGLNSSAIFVDGGNVFDPYTLSLFSRLHNLDPREALEKIYISRAFTAYQLTSLIFEKMQKALKKFESKLVVVSDISGLFLDRDVPKTEARDIFNSLTVYLSDFASKMVRSCLLHITLILLPEEACSWNLRCMEGPTFWSGCRRGETPYGSF